MVFHTLKKCRKLLNEFTILIATSILRKAQANPGKEPTK